jgi:hypothetical protein
MVYFVIGLVLVLVVHFALRGFVRANPAILAAIARTGGGILSLLAALFVLLRGRVNLALGLGGVALWLFGLTKGAGPFGPSGPSAPSGGAAGSRVATTHLEMNLDHATGDMDGTILAGPLAGRRLSQLNAAESRQFYALCQAADTDGARLLETYLERRFPGWRAQGEAGSGQKSPSGGAMTVAEAYDILGLPVGADQDAVVEAHRELMKKLHPDRGGSTYLAARVNAAKDVLLQARR